MKNNRRKGKVGELELAGILREYGYEARRGQQFSGANGDADVVGLPGVHIECKRVEQLNLCSALTQAQRDAKGHELPAVFHRRNREKWQVTMALEDWIKLYRASQIPVDKKNPRTEVEIWKAKI